MGLASDAIYFTLHPSQLVRIAQWKLRHGFSHERNGKHGSATANVCFEFLGKTSRSFCPVVKELHSELLLPVCVFYLILRGLDTIEDDTSIPLVTKEPLLRRFKDYLEQDGWTFAGNRPQEKDRQLLVRFDNVVAEFRKMKPAYQAIIKDTADKMGNGMADFARKAAFEDAGVDTIEEYDLYCWYVAGVVGEGLTRLFVEAGLGEEASINHSHLYRSMGLLLQKNNIIRDVWEDYNDGRRFWPKEIWSKHVASFGDLFKPENLELALNCSSEMVLDALRHASSSLSYLAGLREQSVFNFCAIPQSMAMATLELCFRNPAVFRGNVKIAKGDAIRLMVESSQDLDRVCEVFYRYARRIRQRNDPEDPNFLNIGIACEEIERSAEALAPRRVGRAMSRNKEEAWVISDGRLWHHAGFSMKTWPTAGQASAAILVVVSILILGAAWFMEAGSHLA